MVNIKLADIAVQLDNRYPELESLCRDYVTRESAKIRVAVTAEELEKERLCQSEVFSDGYLETVCLYRKLALELLRFDVFIMHAAVLEVDGSGYAFLAPSGTGKTTQTRLWLQHFGDRARVINGDKPLIRVAQDRDGWQFTAYGTPWCGKEGMGCNASVPLKALFLLERAEKPSCEPAPEEQTIDKLFHQMLMPEDPNQMLQLLTLTDRLVETVPAYILRCNMQEESVIAAYTTANKKFAI